ncbi:MAG: hypothetical protein M1840_007753 [Geoglossum simile]|nr:MAG: hypothetical protein M1840_007753 [Geoglossum simile]
MPPSSVPSENNEELSPLTDENVEVLHSIITTAQSLSQAERPPYRTLFDAYDTALHQNGLDPDRDRVYFRFLLRLGGVPGDGTLFQKFEALLGQMGIRLEFGMGGDDAQEITRHDGGLALGRDESRELVDIPRGRARRASFSSMYDAGDENTQRNGRGTRSHSSMSRPRTSLSTMRNGAVSTRATTRATERSLSHDGIESRKRGQATRGRLTSQDFGRNLRHYRKRGRSTSSPGNLQGWRRTQSEDSLVGQQLLPASVPNPQSYSIGKAGGTSELNEEGSLQGGHHAPSELLFLPSKTRMSLDAESFFHHRLRSVALHVFRQWHDIAAQLQRHRRSAINYDRAILLRQSIDTWRVALRDKKQKAETERFFARFERRATKARDLYLVTKAFTHWAQSASDEVERTSVARRHILRIKCFNAWRDITAVNELKVRRQLLRKFYALWKRSYLKRVSAELKAVAVYGENLVLKMYWAWFWIHKDKRALDFNSRWVKRKYLTALNTNTFERKGKDLLVENVRKQRIIRKFLRSLFLKAQALSGLKGEAREFRDKNLERKGILSWRRQAELIPAARKVIFYAGSRISCGAFKAWLQRTRASRQAGGVDRLRVLRNAWTNWNDRLRMQAIATRINDRVVLQALYKWVLIERSRLLKRLYEKRLKQAALYGLAGALGSQRTKIQLGEHFLRRNGGRNLVASVLCQWRHQAYLNRRGEQLAFDFHALRIIQDTINLWKSGIKHVLFLERCAQEAKFYFLATKTIRSWQKEVANIRRQKRKIAYARGRRMVKINLATRIFALWRERGIQDTALRRQAEALDRVRVIRVCAGQITMWRGRLQETSDMGLRADAAYTTNISQGRLYTWYNNLGRNRTMSEKAGYCAQARVLEDAVAHLRKWRMRVLGNRGRDMNAQLFKERSNRTHFKNIFRYWRSKAAEQSGHRPTDSVATYRGGADLEGDDTRRAEDWTIFDGGLDIGDWIPGLEASSSSTPIPAYLSTPSKRAARAKALLRLVATPGVRKTPLERRIFLTGRDFGKSEFGKSVLGERREPEVGRDISFQQQPP